MGQDNTPLLKRIFGGIFSRPRGGDTQPKWWLRELDNPPPGITLKAESSKQRRTHKQKVASGKRPRRNLSIHARSVRIARLLFAPSSSMSKYLKDFTRRGTGLWENLSPRYFQRTPGLVFAPVPSSIQSAWSFVQGIVSSCVSCGTCWGVCPAQRNPLKGLSEEEYVKQHKARPGNTPSYTHCCAKLRQDRRRHAKPHKIRPGYTPNHARAHSYNLC